MRYLHDVRQPRSETLHVTVTGDSRYFVPRGRGGLRLPSPFLSSDLVQLLVDRTPHRFSPPPTPLRPAVTPEWHAYPSFLLARPPVWAGPSSWLRAGSMRLLGLTRLLTREARLVKSAGVETLGVAGLAGAREAVATGDGCPSEDPAFYSLTHFAFPSSPRPSSVSRRVSQGTQEEGLPWWHLPAPRNATLGHISCSVISFFKSSTCGCDRRGILRTPRCSVSATTSDLTLASSWQGRENNRLTLVILCVLFVCRVYAVHWRIARVVGGLDIFSRL